MSKKKRKRGSQRRKKLSDKVYETLQEISDLIEMDDFDNAYNLLAPLERKYPTNDEIWEERAHFYTNLGDISEAWWSAYRALQLNRDNIRVLTNIINLTTELELPWALQYYIEQYMEYAVFLPPEFRKLKEEIDAMKDDLYQAYPDARDKKLADVALIDFARQLTDHGQVAEGMTVCRRALKLFPDSLHLRQIMSVLLMSQGKMDTAIDYLKDSLDKNPDDVISTHMLSQFYYLYGDIDKAEKIYEDLQLIPPSTIPEYMQRFQLLAILNKVDEILALYQAYLADYPNIHIPDGIFHYVAVATALSGDIKQAKKMWKGMPDTTIAIENLNDIESPISEKMGVSYFELGFIVPVSWIDLLSQPARSEAQIKERVDKLFKDSPYIENLLNILLQRGDDESHAFVCYVCTHHPIPSLYDYATGTKGSDIQRLSVLKILIRHDVVSQDSLPEILLNGQMQIPELFKYKITDESTREDVPKRTQNMIEKCYDLITEHEWDDALDLIYELHELLPNNRTLMNFEMVALNGIGETDEADEILDEMVKKFPDYHFTRMDKARQLIQDKQYDEAQKWIESVESQTEFHVSELKSYAITKIEWFMARNEDDMARNWLHQLEALLPTISDQLVMYYSKLSVRGLINTPIFSRLNSLFNT